MTTTGTQYVYGFRLRTPLTSWEGDVGFLHQGATIAIKFPERSENSVVDSFVTVEAANHEQGFVLAGEALNSCLDSIAFVTKTSTVAYHHFLTLKNQAGSVDRLAFRTHALGDIRSVTFDSDLVSSARALMDSMERNNGYALSLRWLRHGHRSSTFIEQFLFYWLALERLVGDSQIERRCINCGHDMSYQGVPREKLRAIVREHAPEIDDKQFKLLSKTRHMLAHGSQLPDPRRVGMLSSLTPLLAEAVESALERELEISDRLAPDRPFGVSTTTMASGWFRFKTSYPEDRFARDYPSEGAVAKLQPEKDGDPVLCDPPPTSW